MSEPDTIGKDVAFLREAASFFEHADAMGEDRAFWANTYNAEACRRIAERLSREAWMPIETAPKDQPILTYRSVGLMAVAEFFPHHKAKWCVTDGVHILDVTHWQPLPKPPVKP